MTISNRYVLSKQQILSTVATPLKSTHRIKYTCFEISQHLLIFGATSGGIYIFHRDPCSFLQLIPSKEGAVTKVSMSKDERFIAFSTNRGIACVFEWDDNDGAKLINRSLEHNGTVITELVWGDSSNQLYVGDSQGRLSVINVSLFLSNNIFHLPAFIFMQLESGIVQVSCHNNFILVSTETWCYICDTTREQYRQIGSQLREGHYGACFFSNQNNVNIYCGRPGSRLWEADTSGIVKRTHQFKKALSTPPAQLILLEENKLEINKQTNWPEQGFNFCYLTVAMDKYLFTYKEDGIYLFDPVDVKVVLWSNHYKGIMSAKCINNIIYVWTSNGELHSLVFSSVDQSLVNLYFQEQYKLCCQLLDLFLDDITTDEDYSSLSPITGLVSHLENRSSTCSRLHSFLEQLKKHECKERKVATKLDSGIFLVENRHWKKWRVPNSSKNSKSKRKSSKRSRSLPPETVRLRKCSSQFKLRRSVSLPNIHISIELPNSSSDFSSSRSISFTSPPSQTPNENSIQVSFLSNTAPNVIHETILELGHRTSGKLMNGQPPLNSKWQVLEGRFKLLDNHIDNGTGSSVNGVIENGNKPQLNGSSEGDSGGVWHKQPEYHVQKSPIDLSELTSLLSESHTEASKLDITSKIFDEIIEKHIEYCALNGNKDAHRSFPFSQLLSPNHIGIIKKVFLQSFQSGHLETYLKCLSSTRKFSNLFQLSHHPPLLTMIYSKSQLELDIIMKNILIIFSEVVDPFTILQSLELSSLPCFFLSWSAVLDTFQDSAFNYITSNGETDNVVYSEWPLPLLLNTLFLMFRLNQVESSCLMYSEGRLKLYHISYLVLKLSTHLVSTGLSEEESQKNCNDLLLKYVSKLIDKNCLDIQDLNQFCVLEHLTTGFMDVNQVSEPVCVCGFSLLGKNKPQVKFPTVGKLLVRVHLAKFKASEWSELCQINNCFELRSELNDWKSFINNCTVPQQNCQFMSPFKITSIMPTFNNGEMPQFCAEYLPIIRLIRVMPQLVNTILVQTTNDLMECIPFIVQLSSIKDLDSFIYKAPETFCNALCETTAAYSKGKCCICSTHSDIEVDIDWSDAAVLVLKSLGAHKTVALLEKYALELPCGVTLDNRFYRAALLSSMVEARCPSAHTSTLSAYFSQVCRSFSQELSQESDFLRMDENSSPTPVVISDSDCSKWGLKMDWNVDICSMCSLVLNSEQLLKEGLRGFRCGHVYHMACLKLRKNVFKCPLCLRAK